MSVTGNHELCESDAGEKKQKLLIHISVVPQHGYKDFNLS